MSKVNTIIDQLKELTLIEAAELVTAIEETFGVSAAAPVAVAAAGAPVAAAEAAAEKSEFTVKVTDVPADKKIAVIKEVKTILNLGLGDAKAKVEAAPFVVAENVNKEEADKLKNALSAAGATVSVE
ncbi:MAG: 50S ribosomal protein L7/L12 [Patescibacteria group bacterium]